MRVPVLLVGAVVIYVSLLFSANAQPVKVPDSTARITRTMPGNGGGVSVEFENTGFKPINAIVIGIHRPGEPQAVMSEDFPGQPLEHNGRGTLETWRDIPLDQMDVAAVIFTDGSFLGYSKPYDNQSDIVTYIFSRRKAEAAAWIRWQNFLKSLAGKDARTAVDEFIRAVNAIPIRTTFDRITNSAEQNRADDESEGENQVLMALQSEARNAQASLRAHDAKWVLEQHLNKFVAQRAEETSKFAIRKDEK